MNSPPHQRAAPAPLQHVRLALRSSLLFAFAWFTTSTGLALGSIYGHDHYDAFLGPAITFQICAAGFGVFSLFISLPHLLGQGLSPSLLRQDSHHAYQALLGALASSLYFSADDFLPHTFRGSFYLAILGLPFAAGVITGRRWWRVA